MGPLLSFKDIPVYASDLELFYPHHWLNDICINLACRLLEEEVGMESNSSICLMDPAVVSFLRIQVEDEDEFESLSNGLQIQQKEWLLMPINNAVSIHCIPTHWSLLVCHIPSVSVYHIDSLGKTNLTSAKHILPKLAKLIHLNNRKLSIRSLRCVQQSNGFDCGVFVILFAKQLVKLLIEGSGSSFENFTRDAEIVLTEAVGPEDCSTFRSEILATIQAKFNVKI